MLILMMVASFAPVPKAPQVEPPNPVIGKGFAIAPVTTDLQRRIIKVDNKTTTYVMVDSSAALADTETLDIDGFGWDDLRKAIPYFNPTKDKDVTAHVVVHFNQGSKPFDVSGRVLTWTVQGLGQDAGFTRVNTSRTHHGVKYEWSELIAPLRKNQGAREAEAAVGDEKAKIYPVKTPLSKVLLGQIDVMIDVLTPAYDDMTETEASVKKAMAKLQLPAGGKVRFCFKVTNPKRGTGGFIEHLGKQIAKDNGLVYEGISY